MHSQKYFTTFAAFIMMDKFNISAEIRRIRENKGYTIYKLSKKSGVTIAHLQKIESGEISPKISTATDILDALGATLTVKNKR